MFKNWTVAKAAQLGKFMRNHWILHFKQVHFIPNKAVKTQTNKPEAKGADPSHNGPSPPSSWLAPTVKTLQRNRGGEASGPEVALGSGSLSRL